jgi:hypothetical protein
MAVVRVLGNKLYGVCPNCGKIVRMDKPLFGSFHICTTEEERRKYPDIIISRVKAAEALLNDAAEQIT